MSKGRFVPPAKMREREWGFDRRETGQTYSSVMNFGL